MAKLRFWAKPGHTIPVPGAQMPGMHPVFVGQMRNELGEYVPADKPYECDERSPEAMRLLKLMNRESPLSPADAFTAQACGVEFVDCAPSSDKTKKGSDK
jgi:hypothetical protein